MSGLPGNHTDEVNCDACGPLAGQPVVSVNADGAVEDPDHLVLLHRDEQGRPLVRREGGPRVITQLSRAEYERQGGV